MGQEIERKFLVTDDGWRAAATSRAELCQGYLTSGAHPTVRVRLAGGEAWLTIKGETRGAERPEFEYPIPADDARELLRMCPGPLVSKVRHRVPFGGRTWEVDVFAGPNAGLILAEVELESADAVVELPFWVGQDVTADHRYHNSQLAVHPYTSW